MALSLGMALAIVALTLVLVNVWVHVGPPGAHAVTGPLAAALLLVVGRAAGLSWEALGLGREALVPGAVWGGAGAGAVGAACATAVAIPYTRRFFRDSRYQLSLGPACYTAFVAIPLGTVVFEEVAFRGVLWGLLEDEHGAVWATAVSALLFGLWHVLPALDLVQTNAALTGKAGRRRAMTLTVLGTVAFTTLAGVLFAELRRLTGSLLAPTLLHWGTNGFGVLAAARVWAISR
jgi:uncharacterized protein